MERKVLNPPMQWEIRKTPTGDGAAMGTWSNQNKSDKDGLQSSEIFSMTKFNAPWAFQAKSESNVGLYGSQGPTWAMEALLKFWILKYDSSPISASGSALLEALWGQPLSVRLPITSR